MIDNDRYGYLAMIQRASSSKRAWNEVLKKNVREAIKSGHSYRQVAGAAKVSLGVISRIVKEKSSV